MSAPVHVQRCREWIQEQLDVLATLRTANSRDLSFKNWRQNTVTVLQRIWPDDGERVERFRRVVFTPPHARPDGKLSREWFGKGIGESRAYLQSLLAEIDRDGVPEPSATERASDGRSLEDEVGFPMLDLDDDAAPAEPHEAPARPRPGAGGLDVTEGYTTPDEQGARMKDSRNPAPPSLFMQWKAPTPSGLHRREALSAEAPPALGEASGKDATPRAAEARPASEIPRAPSLRPANNPAEPAPAAPAAPVAAKPVEPAKPAPAAPVAAKPVEPAKPAPVAPVAAKPVEPAKPAPAAPVAAKPIQPAPAAPVAAKPIQPAPPLRREIPAPAVAKGKNGRGKSKKPAPRQKLKDLLGLAEFDSRGLDAPADTGLQSASADTVAEPPAPADKAASAPVAVNPPPAPVAPHDIPTPVAASQKDATVAATEPSAKIVEAAPAASAGPASPVAAGVGAGASTPPPGTLGRPAGETSSREDDAADERATLDFMQNSPVFGSIGKPVQRRTDTTEFLDPDAVAVATLATELGRLGVPDGMKVSMQARLLDVAKHVEDGDLEWALLRGTVTDAMQYPELAKRLLPILLPWLERAA